MSKIAYLIAKEDWDALAELKATDAIINVLDDLIENDQLSEADSSHIFSALDRIGDTKAIDYLTKSLQSEEDTIRQYVTSPISNLPIDTLMYAITDEDEVVRDNVAETLSYIGEKAVEPLVKILKKGIVWHGFREEFNKNYHKNEKEPHVWQDIRCSMIEALSNTKSNNAVDILIKIFTEKGFTVYDANDKEIGFCKSNYDCETAAAKGLGVIGDKRAIEPLTKALESDAIKSTLLDETRLEVACSLGLMGDSNGIEILITEYKASKKSERDRSKYLLKKIPPKKVGAVLENLELFDDAEEWYTSAGILDKAAGMRKKKADMSAAKVSQKIVQGDEITKTEIKDSVLNRSTVGGGSSKMQEMKELKEMFDSGFISKEEMEKMKKEILNG